MKTVTVELTDKDINTILQVFDLAWQGCIETGRSDLLLVVGEQTIQKILRAGLEGTQAAKLADQVVEGVRS